MITEAIQLIIDAVVNSFSPVVDTDNSPKGVFAVHQEDIAQTLRDKKGIYGFEYNVVIHVTADTQEEIDPVTVQITNLLEEASGDISGTVFEGVNFISSLGVTFDEEKKKFYDQLTFLIQTKNR